MTPEQMWDKFIDHLNKAQPLGRDPNKIIPHSNLIGSIASYKKVFVEALKKPEVTTPISDLERARETLRRVCPYSYTDLSADEAHALLQRIDNEKISHFQEGSSLHCWSTDYMIDGKHYQVIYEAANPSTPTVMLVTPN